jgi:hypothetical protein
MCEITCHGAKPCTQSPISMCSATPFIRSSGFLAVMKQDFAKMIQENPGCLRILEIHRATMPYLMLRLVIHLDSQLLEAYARTGSERAFRELQPLFAKPAGMFHWRRTLRRRSLLNSHVAPFDSSVTPPRQTFSALPNRQSATPQTTFLKSIYPRSTSVLTSCTRRLSPTRML